MAKRDFFRVLIKLFGLYSAVSIILFSLPTYIGYLVSQLELITIILTIGILVIIVSLLIMLIFKADKVIDLLKLDKGFDDERIEFGSFKEINILKLALLIISGLLLIEHFPLVLTQSYIMFKKAISGQKENIAYESIYDQLLYPQFIISVLSILVSYFLITNYNKVAQWILKADKNKLD